MKSQYIKNIVKKLPDTPGVYVFKCREKIIYIGKATSLRDRVRSYFNADIVNTRSPLISKMLSQFDAIEHIKTDSVLEALVLEAYLIKKHQPEANIKEKDNKSFNFVVITKEDFPRVLTLRRRELEILQEYKGAYTFGPFPSGGQLREAMKMIRKMFPYRDEKCTPCAEQLNKKGLIYDISYISKNKGLEKNKLCKPCFNRQIGLCPGVCTGEVTKEEYAKQIENIILFFEGKKKRVIKNLQKQMELFSYSQEYEKAGDIKRRLFTLTHIQDVALIKDISLPRRSLDSSGSGDSGSGLGGGEFRIESYDIAHLSGTNVVGVMTVVEDGEVKKSDYRKFKIKEDPGVNDTKALREVLARRLGHIEWRMPDLVVVDGGTAQKRAMEKVLREHKVSIPVVSVVKDEHHRPKEILGDKKWLIHERAILLSNAEAHRFAITFHKLLRGKL